MIQQQNRVEQHHPLAADGAADQHALRLRRLFRIHDDTHRTESTAHADLLCGCSQTCAACTSPSVRA